MENPEKRTNGSTPEAEHIPTLAETIQAIKSKLTERELKVFDEIHDRANRDKLTGLDNRHKFEEEFNRRKNDLEQGAEKAEHPDVLLILDLDNFKIVNDAFREGHAGGDRVLKQAAEHLLAEIQKNFRDDDPVARYGGEEFAVLLKNVDVEGVLKRLKLGLTVELDGEPIPITFSGGLSEVKPGENLETVFARADTALFVAKEDKERPDGTIDRGRNRILPYSEQIEKEARKRA